MALITIRRNPSIDQNSPDFVDQGLNDGETDANDCHSVNECYFAVRGAAIILPHEECIHVYKSLSKNSVAIDIQRHLQSMFRLLRAEDTLKMAVKLESIYPNRTRYLIIVNCVAQSTEQSCLLGIDYNESASIGLVLPVWADTRITLDGDGGFSITSYERHHIFKPVSVQAMWSALQTLHRVSANARQCNYFEGGGSHSWIKYYEQKITIERSSYSEWHAIDELKNLPPSPDVGTKPPEQVDTEMQIRAKLKAVMMCENLDEVTSKYIRTKMEKELQRDLSSFKSFIDEEMLRILGQMDESSQIFDYLYLGSEWNASNFEELKGKGVGKILNVTREIDNFFPGLFDYYNIRVYDDDSTEMLKYWDKTFKYIRKARDEGSKVLVHCKKGISRSASVVLAFVMKETGWKLEEAFEYVKNKRNCIRPNSGFLKQLEIYEGILDASKQRHSSLWKSKSETNLVSKDIRLKRKSNAEFASSKSRAKEFNQRNDCNKENSNLNNLLSVPGAVERPKSWSPEDCAYNEIISNERTANVRGIKSKRFNGRQRFGTDPSCYNIVEAMKKIDPNLIENSEMTKSSKNKISSVKSRVTNFESGQTQTTAVTDVFRIGKVSTLANQFETNHWNVKRKQKDVMIDLSNVEAIDKSAVQSKPPIPKLNDKTFSKPEPQDICDILDNDSHSSQYLTNDSKLGSDIKSVELNNYYMKEESSELRFSDSSAVRKRNVINTKRKAEECFLKRTNSYDSILKLLSLSLFDAHSNQQSHEEPKGHKRSISNPNTCPATTSLPNRWCARPSSFSFSQSYRSEGIDRLDRPQSKSMPSVVEAVNEVLSSTRVVMNSLFESIPDASKTKSKFESSVSMDCESSESSVESKLSKSLNESVFYTSRHDSKTCFSSKKSILSRNLKKDSEGVVKRLTEKIEAKVKGSKGDNDSHESNHSQSTPSSPNFNRNERPRSSTLDESSDGQKGKSLQKTNFEFSHKRIKSQSFDHEMPSNRSFPLRVSSHSNKWSAERKKDFEALQSYANRTQTKISAFEAHLESKHLTEGQPKKQQQGRTHPLTRLKSFSLNNPSPTLDRM